MAQSPDPNNQSNSPQPIADQITGLVVRVIQPGGLAAGGLGAFWFGFVQSDAPKAIASGIIGILISYGAKLLGPIHRGTETRLEQAGTAINERIDNALKQPAVRSFEDQYLECQRYECQTARSEGMTQEPGLFTPLLEEVFVPLELGASAVSPGLRQAVFEQFERALGITDIWEFLSRAPQEPIYRQMAILAWGGYGKTTLLRHITYLYSQRKPKQNAPKLIPVLLILRKYRALLSQPQAPNLPDLITLCHIPRLPGGAGVEVPSGWAERILRQGQALVMLDGFDEVAKAERPEVARWINEQMRQYSKCVFIVTSRPKAYQEQAGSNRLELTTSLWVKDFDATQRRAFVEKWYFCQTRYAHGGRTTPDVEQIATNAANDLLAQIEDRSELKDLAKNPLLLNMLVTFHRRYPGAKLPRRRVELYRDICLLQLRDRPAARELDTLLTQCDAQTILQMLALNMMVERKERLEYEALFRKVEAYLTMEDETVDPTEFLKQVVQISELLVEREPGEFEFSHLSFQEYLAACEAVRKQKERLLYEYFGDDWWKQTILLYSGLVKNPTTLIREALQRGTTDLAYRCWQDTTKRIDSSLENELKALQQTVQTSRYKALRDYLKSQQWGEADNETYRLMITAVGKDDGQYFTEEELLNFPCDELRALDRLWVQYSNGKWGFSVQKHIWEECGSPVEYNAAWERFGERVGWRSNGDWKMHPTYSLKESLPGEFPCVHSGLWQRTRWWRMVSLVAQRLVSCSID